MSEPTLPTEPTTQWRAYYDDYGEAAIPELNVPYRPGTMLVAPFPFDGDRIVVDDLPPAKAKAVAIALNEAAAARDAKLQADAVAAERERLRQIYRDGLSGEMRGFRAGVVYCLLYLTEPGSPERHADTALLEDGE